MTLTLRQIAQAYKEVFGVTMPGSMSYSEAAYKLRAKIGLAELQEVAAKYATPEIEIVHTYKG